MGDGGRVPPTATSGRYLSVVEVVSYGGKGLANRSALCHLESGRLGQQWSLPGPLASRTTLAVRNGSVSLLGAAVAAITAAVTAIGVTVFQGFSPASPCAR